MAAGACRHFPPIGPGDPPPPKQTAEVVFDVIQENYAWGYRFDGIYVDASGDLYRFQWREGAARPSERRDSLTAGQLEALHAVNRRLIRRLPADSLAMMRALAEKASTGPWSDTTTAGADMGSTEYSIYRPDASGRYRRIGLRLRGDMRYDNRSEAAAELADWLDRLR